MEVLDRNEIEDKYKWKLEDLFSSDKQWEEMYEKLEQEKSKIASFDSKLNNANDIYDCLRANDNISIQITKLYLYAKMRLDQDVSQSKYQALTDRVERLSVEIGCLASYIVPQLMENSTEFLLALAADPKFKDYNYYIEELIRNKKHTLSEKEEKILAMSSSFSDLFHDAFSMFDNADIRFEEFEDSKGEKVRLSHGLYSLYMQSPIREDRQKAYKAMFEAFKNNINTLSVLYSGNVKKNIFYSKARNFDSCLSRAVNGENVPIDVYTKLIECIHNNIPKLTRFLEYRQKCLGYDKLCMYDLHTPIVDKVSPKVEYEQAVDIVKNALLPLGQEYQDLLNHAFSDGWIDVYENKGKRSGAYSWGCYSSHPYVLLNYQPTTHDIFTIAHELGHAMHTYYSNQSQPLAKADYEIFVAEVASTVNEVLLLQALLKNAEGDYKKYLLSYMLDMFRTTVFRQTQFAEFEVQAHTMAEQGQPLTPQSLCDTYLALNKKYYTCVESDDLIKYEWARIPHFYRSFYVYKYATGLISAVCIASDILSNGDKAVSAYKKFLSAGGSMPPVEILKLAGVDLTTDKPYTVAMDYFENIMSQLEKM